MKEIWMEKLIELLNEYAEQLKFISKRKIEDKKVVVGNAWPAMSELMLISKSYWFIKWLVENDKIDRDKVEKEKADYYFIEMFDNDEIMLMLLSISNTPIEDLILYLK